VVIFLKNGDRLSGEIISQNETRVVLKSPVTGRVTLPRAQIERITPLSELNPAGPPPASAAAPVPVPPPPAAATTPTTAAVPAPATKPVPAAANLASALPVTNAVPVEPWLPGWFTGSFTNWHGNVQLGANLGFGTSDRQALLINAGASKKWGRTTTFLDYSMNYAIVDGVQNANRMTGGAKADVELSANRRLYTYGQFGAGYDDIRLINLELIAGSGMGYRFIDRKNLVVAGELGGQYQAFDYSNAPDQHNVAVRLGENLTTKLGEKLTLTQRLGFTPGIDDLSDFQVRFGLTLSCPLLKSMTLNLNIVNEYDSTPAPTVSNNDLQVSTTIGVNF
jgi:hypothetical protein